MLFETVPAEVVLDNQVTLERFQMTYTWFLQDQILAISRRIKHNLLQ